MKNLLLELVVILGNYHQRKCNSRHCYASAFTGYTMVVFFTKIIG